MELPFEKLLKDFYETEIKDDPEFEGIPLKHVSHLCKTPFSVMVKVIKWGPIKAIRMNGLGKFEPKEFQVRARVHTLWNHLNLRGDKMIDRIYYYTKNAYEKVKEFVEWADKERGWDNGEGYGELPPRDPKI